jgi:hypothetical protein
MTPYAVEVRYDDEFDPGLQEAGQALDLAIKVHQISATVVGVAAVEW